ncbi:hypothetical protein D7Z54_01665 [Salibacterium salarium]|uniref:Uncharacterized protein n=1 Tax=Salibacterium salarium TaxID=284579 RepID=A0A3R9PPE2_9BACI|nr:hypothetical protein [Salibacterium salarium]RSL35298.1 hypothetical protein D7Z54_01665 [Salibacterium salarium]
MATTKKLQEDLERETIREKVIYVDGVEIISQALNEPSEEAITSFRRGFKDYIRDKRINEGYEGVIQVAATK